MRLFRFLNIWLFLSIVGQISAISYNMPKLCPNASWNLTATTFADITTAGTYPFAIFVNTNNTVYLANRYNDWVRVWLEGNAVPIRNITDNLNAPASLFVTDTYDIYVDNGLTNYRVDKWSINSTSSVPQMYMCGTCYGLFIDISNNLYCAMFNNHQVVSKSLTRRLNIWSIVAGSGVAGTTSMTLYYPRGIFVDINLNLYVADSSNNRIQKFSSGQLAGTTLAGTGATGTIALYYPTSVVLDADGYLFIADSYNHRIIGSDSNGFRCIMACAGAGSTATQLYNPLTLSFDSYGNIFVADWSNNRIQKFLLITNSCGGTITTTMTAVTTPTSIVQPTTSSTSISYLNAVSYNRPRFNTLTSWSGNAITLATSTTVGGSPYGLFVDINNTVYVADEGNSRIQVFREGSTVPTRTITGGLAYPFSIFATINGDIYVDNGYAYNRVDKWTFNGTTSSSVMYVKGECYGLFIDINNNLYCSMFNKHQVVTKSLNSNSSMWIVAGGTDCYGSTSNTLYYPRGIFVDTDLNLYVADSLNNRIQKFPSEQGTGITVAGSTAVGTITLYYPSGVILDGDDYLFIVDSYNHRIVASGSNGFRCIVGCSTVGGSSSSQLYYPSDLKFDSYGNIFVTDRANGRIQKFIIIPNTTYPFSFNQPNFCPSTTWYLDAVTFANTSTIGVDPYGIFVNINNTVYAANRQLGLIQIWLEGNVNPNKTISGGVGLPLSLFTTLSGDIYIDNGVSYGRVDKWPINTNSNVPVMTIIRECYSIFVDITNTVYCAMTFYHQIAKKWLNDSGTTFTVAAGTGGAGSIATMLNLPAGLFIDINLNLYVGDCGNNRIQMFPLGQMAGITIAGNTAPGTITLYCPNAITFDANGYLFISDSYNHRIIGSGPYGFRCLFGCTGIAGSTPSQLYYPRTFSFDSYGNLFVVDQSNYRIQKFILASNSCTLSYNQPELCTNASWNLNASTLVPSITIGLLPYGIFIDGINTIYMASRLYNLVSVWPQGSSAITRNISGNLNRPFSIFVSIIGDVYIDNGYSNGRVDKFLYNTSNIVTVMNVNGSCYGLFIDINNYLYCSLKDLHQVVQILLNNGTTIPTIAAGNGSSGANSNMLNSPQGIYVDSNFNLYIADCGNDRIQVFQSGQLVGTTAAGAGAPTTITLDCPTGIVLDTDGYLFIVDSNNHRIVSSDSNGFRCLLGCSGGGSTLSQLSFPQSMAFDSYGNIYVTDRNNSRIQKFSFQKSSCTRPTTTQTTTIHITSTIQTTIGPTTSALHTTIVPGTSSVGTTGVPTTSVLSTTVVPITSSIGITTLPTTSKMETTGAPITSSLMTTTVSITSAIETTVVPTTSASVTTGVPITDPVSTTVVPVTSSIGITTLPATSEIETTVVPTTSSPNTITVSITDPVSTTVVPITSSIEITTLPTTSEIETTVVPTTSASVTTEVPITDPVSTTVVPITSSIEITTLPTTSEIETTVVPTTSASVTTEVPITDPVSTTVVPITSSIEITTLPTTSEIETTVVPTTSASVTTEVPITDPVSTTVVPITSSIEITTLPTTSEIETTVVPTTSSPSTTTVSIINIIETTVVPTTSVIQSTEAPTTNPGENTLAWTTTTMEIIVAPTSNEVENTTVPPTTAMKTTILPGTDGIHTTIVPTTNVSETTAIPTTSPIQTTVTERSTQLQIDESTSIEQHSTTITSTISLTTSGEFNQSCYSPTVTLIPGQSSLASTLQFRRSQDFSISSLIQFNCDISLSTISKWTVKNCSTSICSFPIELNKKVLTTFGELYIPAKTLAYGIYQLTFTVTMADLPSLKSSSSAYVRITASGITANLVQLGTSMVTRGNQQDLFLDPGTFSVDPDEDSFDPTKWKYQYYCRIYGLYNFPNLQGVLLAIDDSRIDHFNPSCLSNRSENGTRLIYGNSTLSPKSSVTILGGSLQSNRIYQFMAYLENRKNSSIQATGYVLVTVEDTRPQLIAIGCVISTMCVPNLEFQLVNPTTQVALFAICIGSCLTIQSIQWNIYQGTDNSSLNSTQWILFNQMNFYENIWFFGLNTSNFTAINQLFLNNPQINLWRFEVVYTFLSETSSSALNFIINHPPYNGSCSIYPLNGTVTTTFTVSCPDWFDDDGIKDYSLYVWTNDVSQRVIVAFSPVSNFQVRLPAGDHQTSLLNIVIYIRDLLDCVREINMSSINVVPNPEEISKLVNDLQSSSNEINNNQFIRLLSGGNQNVIGQVITSLSQEFNQMNNQNVDHAVANHIPAASISISSLGSQSFQQTSMPLNESALIEYEKDLNSQANVRDYLMKFLTDLPITTSNSIKLQSSSLAQLTQSTNQLTRTAAMLAADKCYQLSLVLYSMARKIPYEDVQIASTQLTQCATNVLTAINGPLQQRTSVLDLDLSRANAVPTNYDTDLESEWSDLNFLTNGNDLSLAQNRNIYYQKQSAMEITTLVTKLTSLITSSLNIHLNLGQNLTINTSQTFMTLETISIQSLENKLIQQIGNARFEIPSSFTLNPTKNSSISLRSTMAPLASFGKSQSNTNLSTSISLSITDQNGNDISFQTNSNQLIHFFIPRDSNIIIPSMNLQNVTLTNSTNHNLFFYFHYINISSSLTISIHIEMRPLNTTLAYLIIYKFDQTPLWNSSIKLIDGWTLFCPSHLTNESIYTYFIDNQHTEGHQSFIFGVRELNFEEIMEFCTNNSSINNSPITDQRFNFTSDYELRIYTSGCYYLDSNNNWKSDGLVVGSLTNHYETECYSTHLTTFAGGFIVLPSPINWNYVFANADFLKNKTVYFTVICTSIFYIILMIFARFKDKKDLEKLGVTPLADNQPSDQYFYQILVFTGQRMNAGTQSKVAFVLSGDKDETPYRRFTDPHRKIFQRGGIDAFILAVPKSLGLLNYIRIWHDNSGENSSASWFLKYLIVRDLQTMEKFYFIAQRWFAVEKDDGLIERVLPVAGEIETQEFSYVLSKKTYHSVSDGHLWFSIFSHPPSNKFTRIQRCTCCFTLLFSSMLLNIMYYDLSTEAKISNQTESNSFAIGPFYISAQQIAIGVMVELFSLVPSLLIVQFFRRIRTRQQISPLHQALNQIRPSTLINLENVNPIKKKRSYITFPWWCLFLAYSLSLMIMMISIFFIIVRGIEFGDLKTQKWLTSILTGLFSSIFLTQPIKIVCLAIFFTLFCRNFNHDPEESEYLNDNQINFPHNEEYLHSMNKNNFRISKATNRLTQGEVAYAREQRLKEIQIRSIMKEFLTYLIFLILIYLITYSHREENSFFQVQHLRSYFLNTRQSDNDYTQISTINQYWEWLENTFADHLRAQQWYNEEMPWNLNGYINDKTNRLIGWATMRQLRIKSELCSDQHLILICENDYSLFNEEKYSYQPGWINQTSSEDNSAILKAFQYQASQQLDTYFYIGQHATYNGGGYVYEFHGSLSNLKSNLSQLHQLDWIDSKTRAILIQFTLYNPNVQLFTSVTFLLELLSTGSIHPSARFEPISFYTFASLFQLICIILYIAFIIYLMIKEIPMLFKFKLKYFKQFWSVISLGIVGCSWGSIGVYVWRFHEANRLSQLFEQTNGYMYVNLQLAVYVNDLLTFLLGFCCFFGTIQFIHLVRFNQRLTLFTQTLSYAGQELLAFFLMFTIIFMSFICLFYLLFVSKMGSCADLLRTAQMLFEITLMKFDTSELINADVLLGPLCFALFIFLVVFVCLSMFLSIINDSFRRARANRIEDQEIFSFILKKFLRWTGLKKLTESEIQEERDCRMRSTYFDPIVNFPDRIDQLLETLERLYISQKAELTRLDRAGV